VLRTSASYTPLDHDISGLAAPNIRGFANSFTLRDGFRVRVGNSDTFNMDRVEIIKGASAVLYGISQPGGMVNFVTKTPQPRDFTRVTAIGGNDDFLRGTLDLLVLKTLSLEPMHGWGISQRIQELSRGLLEVNQGSLYPALQRLEHRGLVESRWDTTENNRRAKYYALTRAGERALGTETGAWYRYAGAVEWILEAGS